LLVVATPWAAGAAPRVNAATQRQAEEHFMRGRAFHEAKDYDRAVGEYLAAYQLVPLPELLFNIGQVYRDQGSPQKALHYYQEYLAAEPNGRGRGEAEQAIGEIQAEIASEPAPPPEPAQVAAPAAEQPQPTATPAQMPVTPAAQGSPLVATPAPAPDREAPRLPGWALATMGAAGVATVATGIGLNRDVGGSYDHLQATCGTMCPPSSWQGLQTRADVSYALIAVGAVAVAATAVLTLIRKPARASDSTRVGLWMGAVPF
jgi:tetratricopeptide (TPR) repeat protein